MAYVPQNVNVYSAAFAGAMAAVSVPDGAFIIDPTTGNYASQAAVAAAFAQAVDTAWTGVPNQYDLDCIKFITLQTIGAHNIGPLGAAPINTQANWTTTAVALVAAVKQGDTNAASPQNITLPGAGGTNRAYGSGTATTAGAATITTVLAAKLIAKGSGIFLFTAKISWSALTAADVGTITTRVFTDAAPGTPLTLANAGSIGFGTAGVAQPGNTAVANNGVFTANAGAGIVPAGASAGFTYDTLVVTQGTAAVGGGFYVAIVTGNTAPGAVETPFAIGATALVTVALTNSVAARATGNITASLVEL